MAFGGVSVGGHVRGEESHHVPREFHEPLENTVHTALIYIYIYTYIYTYVCMYTYIHSLHI
jgi:hypothetical protein